MSVDKKSVLDVDAAINWALKYAPDATIHVTGGEPFVLPGMVESIKRICEAGFKVAVFTNGSLLRNFEDEGVYELPVAWQICHHPRSIGASEFMHQIDPIRYKPHVVCRIAGKETRPSVGIKSLYRGFNFKWIEANEGFIDFNIRTNWNPAPCSEMLLIGIKGEVFQCSSPSKILGNVYDMSFDRDKAQKIKCHAGKYPERCQACQSTEILEDLLEGCTV